MEETFTLIRDDLVSIWARSTFKVKAKSLEEAVELVKNEDGDRINYEYIYESEQLIEPGVIDNNPTTEIFDKNIDNILWHN